MRADEWQTCGETKVSQSEWIDSSAQRHSSATSTDANSWTEPGQIVAGSTITASLWQHRMFAEAFHQQSGRNIAILSLLLDGRARVLLSLRGSSLHSA